MDSGFTDQVNTVNNKKNFENLKNCTPSILFCTCSRLCGADLHCFGLSLPQAIRQPSCTDSTVLLSLCSGHNTL